MSLHRFLFLLSKRFRNNKIIRFLILPFWKQSYKNRRKKSIKAFNLYGTETIKIIFENLLHEQIHIWLEFGTLLGAFRNNDFIPHDIDIDLGAFLSDVEKIDNFFKNLNFKLVREFKMDDGKLGLERTYSYKGVFIDVFYFKRKKDYIFTYGFEKSDSKDVRYNVVKYIFKDSGFITSSFKNVKVLIPADVEDHLKSHYGKDFMVPDPNYSDKNAPNRTIVTDEQDVSYEEFY